MTTTLYRWHSAEDLASWSVEQESPTERTLRSPIVALPADCSEIVPSWHADTPAGTTVEIRLRVRSGGTWSNDYRMALWDSATVASQRTSFTSQRDDVGAVATDTLVVRPGADAVEAIVICRGTNDGQPQLCGLSLVCSSPTPDTPHSSTHSRASCHLQTPAFSQFMYDEEDGWCSPTSLAMVLGYWAERDGNAALAPFTDPASVATLVAPGVYDPQYEGYGNWSFNVAFAASYGLQSYVMRMHSIAEIEPWLAAGVPVVMSIAWNEGQLTGAPIPRSRGHLIVATGLTADGDLCVADPAAAQAQEVPRTYRRAELETCWLRPFGTVYLIYPQGWTTC